MRIYPILLLIVGATSMFAQDAGKIYFDEKWRECEPAAAHYFRLYERENDSLYRIEDFFLDEKIQMRTLARNFRSPLKTVGECVWYHRNGKRERASMFIEGQNSGYDSLWYPTGELQEAGTFDKGQRVGIVQEWYRKGARSQVRVYFHDLKDSVWTSWYPNGTVSERTLYDRGRIVDGRKWYADGRLEGVYGIDSVDRLPMWTWYDSQGNVCAVEVFQGTEVVRGRYINEDGTEHNDPLRARSNPEFHGDGGSMKSYMQRATRYPEKARRAGKEGTIVVQGIITEHGSLEKIQIIEGGDPYLEEEALRVVRTMKQWKPGRKHNRPTAFYIQLPFVFELN